jgi:hypothetical protein
LEENWGSTRGGVILKFKPPRKKGKEKKKKRKYPNVYP